MNPIITTLLDTDLYRLAWSFTVVIITILVWLNGI